MNDLRWITGAVPAAGLWGAGSPQGSGGSGSDRDDAGLLRRIAAGDQAAMAEFYQRHGQVVLVQVLLLVDGERALAEEIVQDAMLAVWRGAGSFRGESRPRSWVIAIARRRARDRLRRQRPRVVTDAVLAARPACGPDPELAVLERAEFAEVAEAIRRLAPAHREVIGLVFGAGLSLPEAAGVLQVPLGTVKSRLTRARAALGRVLDEKGHHHE